MQHDVPSQPIPRETYMAAIRMLGFNPEACSQIILNPDVVEATMSAYTASGARAYAAPDHPVRYICEIDVTG